MSANELLVCASALQTCELRAGADSAATIRCFLHRTLRDRLEPERVKMTGGYLCSSEAACCGSCKLGCALAPKGGFTALLGCSRTPSLPYLLYAELLQHTARYQTISFVSERGIYYKSGIS